MLWFLGTATFWLVFGTSVGEYLGIKFVAPDVDQLSWLSFGRLRPVHTNAEHPQLGMAAAHRVWRLGHLLSDHTTRNCPMTPKHDITGIDDIKLLVDEFYTLVRHDALLAPIFLFRLNTYWEPHLEKMYTFWNAALFGVKGYTGNPLAKHVTMPVGGEHFERWLSLFHTTVDTYFEGPMAEDAKKRALIMATNFERRIDSLKGTDKITLI